MRKNKVTHMDRYRDLDEQIESYDAYLRIDSSDTSDMYYLSGFDAPDPYTLLRIDGRTVLLVSTLEYGRAKKESFAAEVRNTSEYIEGDLRGDDEAELIALDSFLADYGVESVAVPRSFSLYTAEKLRDRGYSVEAIEDGVKQTRSTKSSEEVDYVRKAQAAAEEAMGRAEEMLRSSENLDGVLMLGGEPLTAGRVKTEIEIALLRRRCSLSDTIVACGAGGSDPHWRGEGELVPDEPIIIDIFPRHESKYHGDLTRTFVVGGNEDASRMYEATIEAQEAAFDLLETGAGVGGDEVHEAVCDVYEDWGYSTLRDGGEEGFIHSTGHGVGLDVHEEPRLSRGAGELGDGSVVTVEPGLYLSDIGGVRVEDLVVVREDGMENLTSYEKQLGV